MVLGRRRMQHQIRLRLDRRSGIDRVHRSKALQFLPQRGPQRRVANNGRAPPVDGGSFTTNSLVVPLQQRGHDSTAVPKFQGARIVARHAKDVTQASSQFGRAPGFQLRLQPRGVSFAGMVSHNGVGLIELLPVLPPATTTGGGGGGWGTTVVRVHFILVASLRSSSSIELIQHTMGVPQTTGGTKTADHRAVIIAGVHVSPSTGRVGWMARSKL
mmetsp:Transcript_4678/g.13097  ORF Transcript_4678/g.13097 Transcript_4678/m.13097 type:complete len:215 (-) Transcript_4678:35-679(-)